jgi:hypothetical protein
MTRAPADRAPGPALPARARPSQVLLAVGAVLLVIGTTALALEHGGVLSAVLLLYAAAGVAALSLRADSARLRSSAETLAVCAAGFGLASTVAGGPVFDGEPVTPFVLAGGFLALRVVAPTVTTWPLASWFAFQFAVVRMLDELPAGVHGDLRLIVALVGLGVAVTARRAVARVALVTTAPWWLLGVVGGTASSWTGGQFGRWSAAALMVLAGAALVPARLRRDLEPLLGQRTLAPVIAGMLSGTAITGALSPAGVAAVVVAGWAGVAVAAVADLLLTGWRRGLLLPAAVAAGATTAVLCVGQLLHARAWGALSLLLLLTALPPTVVTVLRPRDRHVTAPIVVWCLTGSVLLALPADVLGAGAAAVVLAVLYAVAMETGAGLVSDVRRPLARAAALTGGAAIVLAAVTGRRGELLAVLLLQGLATLGWAVRAGRRTGTDVVTAAPDDAVAEEISAGWRIGAAQLTVAGWTAAALASWHAIEAWTLPLALGLLIAAGPRLLRGPSWPAWGPGLVVAAAPSTLAAMLDAGGPRPVPVLVAAVLVLLAGSRAGVRAPLAVGAGTAVVLVLGLAVPALPWPLTAALVVGVALLGWGTVRERRPVAGFRFRLAELR